MGNPQPTPGKDTQSSVLSPQSCQSCRLVCPVCGAALERAERVFRCANRHSFDIAREGYVNLLLPGPKRPKYQGDSKEMLLARRNFLDRGHYAPLADAVNALVARHLGAARRRARSPAPCILDAGCGEGYYPGRLRHHLANQGRGDACCYGVDVSKDAARLAARRYADVHFAVADINAMLPFASRSVGVLLDIFAPRNPAEFRRLVAPDGLLLVAIPSPRHLLELRSSLPLLALEEDKERRTVERFAGAFELVEARTLEYELALTGDDLMSLVLMTPSARHLAPATRERLRATDHFRTTAGFTLLSFRPAASI